MFYHLKIIEHSLAIIHLFKIIKLEICGKVKSDKTVDSILQLRDLCKSRVGRS